MALIIKQMKENPLCWCEAAASCHSDHCNCCIVGLKSMWHPPQTSGEQAAPHPPTNPFFSQILPRGHGEGNQQWLSSSPNTKAYSRLRGWSIIRPTAMSTTPPLQLGHLTPERVKLTSISSSVHTHRSAGSRCLEKHKSCKCWVPECCQMLIALLIWMPK